MKIHDTSLSTITTAPSSGYADRVQKQIQNLEQQLHHCIKNQKETTLKLPIKRKVSSVPPLRYPLVDESKGLHDSMEVSTRNLRSVKRTQIWWQRSPPIMEMDDDSDEEEGEREPKIGN
ncbi:hypothetical protein BLNAU_22208 [Blattamonas nauphoetae]|uniref:Uncharacterized protein n=1 Tax=Blattamonas nauphoetae TaxID=2049346 RepID=A0ABQ9WUQ6_9EUKA|nr:hypothetical protein BLNAU_22208 [Blattamonas nauphoetae]